MQAKHDIYSIYVWCACLFRICFNTEVDDCFDLRSCIFHLENYFY